MLGYCKLKIGLRAAGGLLALALFAGTAFAQAPIMPPPAAPISAPGQNSELDELRARVEKLERMNAQLLDQLQNIGVGSAVSKDAVSRIVEETLQKNEAEKKKAEEKKKVKTPQQLYEEAMEMEKKAWHRVDGSDLTAKYVHWKSGHITFESPGKDFLFQVTGRLHADMGWFTSDDTMPQFRDATTIRRARIGLQGRIWENMYFRTAYDWANSTDGGPFVNFRDLYIRLDHLPWFGRIQVGQMKEQLSLSWSSTSNGLVFLERPLAVNAFIPDRNTGMLFARNFGADDRIWLGAGMYRNLGNAGAASVGDGQYAVSGRITALPYWSGDGRCLVHVGAYGRHASYAADRGPRFGDRAEARIGTPRIIQTNSIIGATDHSVYGVEAAAVFGRFLLQGEAIGTSITLPNGARANYWGAYGFVSCFLTGENHRYKKSSGSFTTPIPYQQFYWLRGPVGNIFSQGAWEVACRWSYLNLRDPNLVVPVEANLAGGTGIFKAVTLGVNWYLNPQTTLMFNYIHGWRDSDTPGADGQLDTFATRLRIWF